VVSVTPLSHLTTGKDPVPILQEAGWASGPIWTSAENLVSPGFDPRTVQPVHSRYNYYATRPTPVYNVRSKKTLINGFMLLVNNLVSRIKSGYELETQFHVPWNIFEELPFVP